MLMNKRIYTLSPSTQLLRPHIQRTILAAEHKHHLQISRWLEFNSY